MEGTAVTHVEVREASERLPERQREALELRDRDGRSYEEIAASLEIGPGAVAQLIAHARINLYDELRGTALASVAPSPECERALPLIAMREDGQLQPVSEDGGWLDSHLAGCERCTLAVEQMGEAEAAYRAQEPERLGGNADRTDTPATQRPGTRRPPEPAGIPVATPPRRSRRALLAGCLACLLLLGGVAAVLAATDRSTAPVESAADTASAKSAGGGGSATRSAEEGNKKVGARGVRKRPAEKRSSAGGESVAGSADGLATVTTAPAANPVESGSGGAAPGNPNSGGNRSSGKAAVEPTRQTSSSKPSAKPKSPPASTSTPQSTTATPPPEPTPPPEEVDEPGHRGEPPGKAVGRPTH
jgi:sigma-70-like protein